MKRRTYSSAISAIALTAALLAGLPTEALAQSRAGFAKSNDKAWSKLASQCTTVSAACAYAAERETNKICTASGKFYSKGSTAWTWISFSMVVASAASTAVGASTTLANTKIWSTLGGTTALGAVTTSANSNSTADQNGLAAVNAAHEKFNEFVDANYQNYEKIYAEAPGYATACALAGIGSPTAAKSVGISITTSSLPNGKVGTAYSQTLAATGGTAPYTWAVTGTLPAGLTLSSGVIGGTPTTATPNPVSLTLEVTDSTGQSVTTSLSLKIDP
jgi:large repetitive protein